MYFGKIYDVHEAKHLGIVDDIVNENQLIEKSKQVISSWIDQPGKAFIKLKQGLKSTTAKRIQQRIKEEKS